MENFSPNYLGRVRLKGSALAKREKEIVINVYCYFRRENPGCPIEDIVARTVSATGVSQRSVYRIKKEMKTVLNNDDVQIKDGRKKTTGFQKTTKKYDEFVKCAIRNKIHRDFFHQNKQPTLRKIHAAVRSDPVLPNISISTIRKILCEIGFVYSKRKRNSILIEKPEIMEWRHRYLRRMRRHRENGRSIIYTDETWVNAGHVKEKTWQDTTVKTSKDAFLNGLSTGLKNPSGKGERVIITHAGGNDGFVDGAGLVFKAKKGEGDYHKEMNARTYEEWFSKQLLPNIPENSVIVLDNAPYHSAKQELLPRQGWRKKDIQQWLESKDIAYSNDMIIAELLKLVDPHRPVYDRKKIDEIAKAAGHEVLRTPPYHCELNPIELVS